MYGSGNTEKSENRLEGELRADGSTSRLLRAAPAQAQTGKLYQDLAANNEKMQLALSFPWPISQIVIYLLLFLMNKKTSSIESLL